MMNFTMEILPQPIEEEVKSSFLDYAMECDCEPGTSRCP